MRVLSFARKSLLSQCKIGEFSNLDFVWANCVRPYNWAKISRFRANTWQADKFSSKTLSSPLRVLRLFPRETDDRFDVDGKYKSSQINSNRRWNNQMIQSSFSDHKTFEVCFSLRKILSICFWAKRIYEWFLGRYKMQTMG